jgi:P4 family phage/plasmid primase-like protien
MKATKPIQTTRQYYDFINKYRVTEKNSPHTHTRIPGAGTNRNLSGGKFNIPRDEIHRFYELYYNHVFVNKNEEHLTEVQLKDERAPILIDLDLRYNIDITKRPPEHDDEFRISIIEIYMNKLRTILDFQTGINIPVYIFEKPKVNIDAENSRTKDGVHIIIGVQLEHKYQIELRKLVLNEIKTGDYPEVDKLPITNSWETVLDETISRGTTNWQLYGSNKPGNQRYNMIRIVNVTYDDDNEFIYDEEVVIPTTHVDKSAMFNSICAQYYGNPYFDVNCEFKASLNQSTGGASSRKPRRVKPQNNDRLVLSTSGDFSDVTSVEHLDSMIDDFISSTTDTCCSEHSFRDIYMYLMILPSEYYTEYDKWITVGWALKNVDFRMFIVWMKFSSQWSNFSFSDISERFEQWQTFEIGDNCVTKGSIVYWAREYWYKFCSENPGTENKFDTIYTSSIDYYVQRSIEEPEDYNFAMVLFKMYGDRYKCADIKNNIWYEFTNNRWIEANNATTLYLNISTKQYQLYNSKLIPYVTKFQGIEEDEGDPEWSETKKTLGTLRKICERLKNTTYKEKIIKEAKHLFYDKNFYSLLDTNPYIFGFKNGVVDFSTNRFRLGTKDDYLSKTCGLKYIPKEDWDPVIVGHINQYMTQLFPDPELYAYMWEYIGSIPLGKDHNQTFNNFYGKGQNGKSKFIEIIGSLLGDYYEIIPEAYVTGKRSSVEGTQSSIAKLKGVRFACINEPSEGDSLNEGIMKELTGGDEIVARQLHKEAIRFKPQFKLSVATNHLFKIKSQDDGTWRRFRIVPFMSRFVVENMIGVKYSWEDNPHQFAIDIQLDVKLASKNFKDTFMSMIVHKTFQTEGIVRDVPAVMKETDKYRNGEDFFASFISEKILYDAGSSCTVKKSELHQEFQEWYRQNVDNRVPSSKNLYNLMDNKFGPNRKAEWKHVKIIYDDNDGDDEDL